MQEDGSLHMGFAEPAPPSLWLVKRLCLSSTHGSLGSVLHILPSFQLRLGILCAQLLRPPLNYISMAILCVPGSVFSELRFWKPTLPLPSVRFLQVAPMSVFALLLY